MPGFPAGRRDALLIATGMYESPALKPLRSPRQDCEGLAAVLRDPGIGGFQVQQLVDAKSYEVKRALEQFFRNRGREDLLLLHMSCHGIKDDEGHLYFATQDTDKDLPASTAVPAAFLHDQMARCRARTIIDGSKSVRIPAGLRSGQTLRLVGHGTMHLRGGGRGDLLLHLDVEKE
ncbi:caspase family protein [Streptomyces decoyicus]|uniref:caspase family protein n=1 Tax=Streptomyces decoyicus TaxID=249567 RepID=UPI0037FEFC62